MILLSYISFTRLWEISSMILTSVIIILLLVFSEIIRDWLQSYHRTTKKEEMELLQKKLKKTKQFLRMHNNSDLLKFCDRLDAMSMACIVGIILWIAIKNIF